MCKLFWRTWCILYYGTSDKEEDNDALYGRLVFGNGITFKRVPIVPSSYYRHSFTLFYLLHDHHHHQFILYGMLCVFLEGTSIVKKKESCSKNQGNLHKNTHIHIFLSPSVPFSIFYFLSSIFPLYTTVHCSLCDVASSTARKTYCCSKRRCRMHAPLLSYFCYFCLLLQFTAWNTYLHVFRGKEQKGKIESLSLNWKYLHLHCLVWSWSSRDEE